MADNDDSYPGEGLVSRDVHDELDTAVLTLAETFYECGFKPERSLDMAWALALMPERIKAEGDEPWH